MYQDDSLLEKLFLNNDAVQENERLRARNAELAEENALLAEQVSRLEQAQAAEDTEKTLWDLQDQLQEYQSEFKGLAAITVLTGGGAALLLCISSGFLLVGVGVLLAVVCFALMCLSIESFFWSIPRAKRKVARAEREDNKAILASMGLG